LKKKGQEEEALFFLLRIGSRTESGHGSTKLSNIGGRPRRTSTGIQAAKGGRGGVRLLLFVTIAVHKGGAAVAQIGATESPRGFWGGRKKGKKKGEKRAQNARTRQSLKKGQCTKDTVIKNGCLTTGRGNSSGRKTYILHGGEEGGGKKRRSVHALLRLNFFSRGKKRERGPALLLTLKGEGLACKRRGTSATLLLGNFRGEKKIQSKSSNNPSC